jgi:hypothetical protein
MKKKVYIGCALTHASEDFRKAIVELKENLRKDFDVLDFIGLENGTAKDVYEHDLNCVRTSNLFVADCTYPSIGLGIEIGAAIEDNKQTLIVVHKDAHVTRMILGITAPTVSFRRYNDYAEVLEFIRERLKQV